ncbi:hypothetical protein PAI11_38460 [Patulibacter medicamentivorans]|uniref:Secreted protein n=1 Tax=Patulibacter medicamentivorans TaxID=1097667 RepID=H0EAH2_9ACTN|nr:hypothetical protein [Patulibacter medicamentivorans]EHN09299.1 hypothetical protein PAI11_38460 [Patulibacter medicamentivorans]
MKSITGRKGRWAAAVAVTVAASAFAGTPANAAGGSIGGVQWTCGSQPIDSGVDHHGKKWSQYECQVGGKIRIYTKYED